MSLAGLKKQLNKANQFVSEKIGNAEGTKATDEYIELERQTDVIHAVVDDMVSKTKEVLHPNPALRARMAVNSRINSTRKSCYPHPEKDLGECMTKYGTQLKDGSAFGRSLVEVGETFKELTEIKSKFEDRVKTRFLDPLNRLQTKDINDCMHHRKKLEGRRLDYDCKRRKISRQSSQDHDPDVKLAESKYNESFNLATVAMKNLLDNEEEQSQHMVDLSQALYDYHNECANVLRGLASRLQGNKISLNMSQTMAQNRSNQSIRPTERPKPAERPKLLDKPKPKCRAMYDFEAQSPDELSFKEGDVIELKSKVDSNWFEGILYGKSGLFPVLHRNGRQIKRLVVFAFG
ncbi:unnamed protein product, partial [Medioppia subpectinata]